MKRVLRLAAAFLCCCVLAGCTVQPVPTQAPDPTASPTQSLPQPTQTDAPPQSVPPATESAPKRLVVIDAGHQAKGNPDKEPVGPGSSEMKAKVSGGTYGRFTGLKEYELTLSVALMLQRELEVRGYRVIMVRTEHDVDISNAQRAAVANEAGADVFLRIHANGSENADAHGAETLCQTAQNPYNGDLYAASRKLSDAVLEELCASAGCKKRYVTETDTMSGINWCQVPVTIVEMGYMTNEAEDRRMADPAYQQLLAVGIANGIDRYFAP